MPRPKAKLPDGFGGEIYQIRQEKGLTFDAAEKALGIPSRTLQEHGKVKKKKESGGQMAAALRYLKHTTPKIPLRNTKRGSALGVVGGGEGSRTPVRKAV
ncbi:MAG: hypothetical protein LBD02_06700 [Christensenellaceae bacterium]|nr:hypothetical protein [Christensenellaceae bacterium]